MTNFASYDIIIDFISRKVIHRDTQRLWIRGKVNYFTFRFFVLLFPYALIRFVPSHDGTRLRLWAYDGNNTGFISLLTSLCMHKAHTKKALMRSLDIAPCEMTERYLESSESDNKLSLYDSGKIVDGQGRAVYTMY